MRSFWLIARHEYRRTVVRRGFIVMTAAIPLGMAALIAMAILVAGLGEDHRPVGYVDHSATLDAGLQTNLSDAQIEIRAFLDEKAGRAALEAAGPRL